MRLSPAEQLARLGITLAQMQAEAPQEEAKRFTDVEMGPELLRVIGLPRRPIPQQEDPENVELARFLTERFAKVPNPYPGPMRPIQAIALAEAWRVRGLFAPIRVGGGKTLTSFLLPQVVGCKRPLYVCPASMIPDVSAEFAKYRKDWHGPAHYPMLSYEMLASPSAGEEIDEKGGVVRLSRLELLAPDLIVLDEAHRCAGSTTTTTKRIKAYKQKFPETVVVAMSGTPFKTSIKDASHIMEWCLGAGSPLPYDFLEREAWASYLDAKSGMGPRAGRGELIKFLTPEERSAAACCELPDDERSIVRKAVARRMFETPGFIGTQDPPLDIGLTLDAHYPLHEDDDIEEAYAELRRTMTLPDGTQLMDAMQLSAKLTTIGYGFWNQWSPAPPDDWREKRNAWAKWCRKAIKSNRRGIDSEARMKQAVRKGLYDDEGALALWEEARDAERKRTGLLEPPSVAVWVSDEAVDTAAAWLKEHAGVVWVFHIGLGERISERAGVPYYGAGSVDKNGRHIKKHPGGGAVASVASNGTGKNLQGFWSKNLWLCMPGEQQLGRTHRSGQKASVVENWVYLGCVEHLKSFYNASTHKGKFAAEILQSPQKLRYAETCMPTLAELAERGIESSRWAAAKDTEEDA